MITPEVYIKSFRREHANPMYKSDDVLSKIFNVLFPKCVYETYSTTVYPQYINLKDSAFYIWDNMYWDLFESLEQSIALYTLEPKYSEFCKSYFLSYLYLFLSLRLEKSPILSLAIAGKTLLLRTAIWDQINNDNYLGSALAQIKEQFKSNKDSANCLFHSKLHVFFHERTHDKYTSSANRKRDIDNIVKFARNFLDHYPHNIQDEWLKFAFESVADKKDMHAIEEVSCDIRSIYETVKFLSMIYPDADQSDIYLFTIARADAVHHFQHILSTVENIWDSARINLFSDLAIAFPNLADSPGEIVSKWFDSKFQDIQIQRGYDQIVESVRMHYFRISAIAMPSFHGNLDSKRIIGYIDSNGYHTEAYDDFQKSIFGEICSENCILEIMLEAAAFSDSLSPQDALMRRDEVIGWKNKT